MYKRQVLVHASGAYFSIESAITAPALTSGSGIITTFEFVSFAGIILLLKGPLAAEIIALFLRSY